MVMALRVFFGLFILTILPGCMTPGVYQNRIEQLQIGMSKQDALAVIKGNAVIVNFNWVPGVQIYELKVCELNQGCQPKRLVFVEGRYAGPALTIFELIQGDQIKPGLTVLDWARYGAIPDSIQDNKANNKQEIWVYKYLNAEQMPMQLIVFFDDGKIQNWLNVKDQTLRFDTTDQTNFPLLLEFIFQFGTVLTH